MEPQREPKSIKNREKRGPKIDVKNGWKKMQRGGGGACAALTREPTKSTRLPVGNLPKQMPKRIKTYCVDFLQGKILRENPRGKSYRKIQ